MALPRMRTAEGVLAEIKAQDPGTEVTLHYIRTIIKAGKVPVVPVGCKRLVNVDDVYELLCSGVPVQTEQPKIGEIRRVPI